MCTSPFFFNCVVIANKCTYMYVFVKSSIIGIFLRNWKYSNHGNPISKANPDQWTTKTELKSGESWEFKKDFGSSYLKGMASIHTGSKWVGWSYKKFEDREFQFKYGGMDNIKATTSCIEYKTSLKEDWTLKLPTDYVIT